MLIDARTLSAAEALACDVCVIGGGAAGISTALSLADRGVDVILLEAGGERWNAKEQGHLRGEVADPRRQPRLDLYRQRQLGGTTTVWGGRCAPFDELDLRDREYCGVTGWPIGLEAISPHLEKAHDVLDLGEPSYDARQALADEAWQLFPDAVWRDASDQKLWRFSLPTNFAAKYRNTLMQSLRLRVLLHAPCTQLRTSDSGTYVSTAEIAPRPNDRLQIKAKSFVIASGGLESARLLMVSRDRHPRGLGNAHDQLGRYYMTHLYGGSATLRYLGDPARVRYGFEKTRDGVYARHMITVRPEVQARKGLLNFCAVLNPPPFYDPSHGNGVLSSMFLVKNLVKRKLPVEFSGMDAMNGKASLAARHAINVLKDAPNTAAFSVDWVRRRILSRRKLPAAQIFSASGKYDLLYSAEQMPNPDSRLTLSDTKDAFGNPRLKSQWQFLDADVDSIVSTYGAIKEDIEHSPSPIVAIELATNLRDRVEADASVGSHHMGMTRMSASPRQGVVDAQCRVHGVENVYVASASVFPTSSCMSPTLMITAMALYVADTVAAQLRQL